MSVAPWAPAIARTIDSPRPVTGTVAVDTAVLNSGVGMNLKENNIFDIQGYGANGSWLPEFPSPLYKADGSAYTRRGREALPPRR